MSELPYSFEPVHGYSNYKVTALLRDYLGSLMEHPANRDTIEQILGLINGYIQQLRNLSIQSREETIKEVYKAIDGFFNASSEADKKDIQCKTGCTACCYIDIDISGNEAAAILSFCNQNDISIDTGYLTKQAAVGRKSYSDVSKCVFLKDNICSIYPVRPIACRKHWVKSDPALCDFSTNEVNRVNRFFDINTEILSSALLNVDECGSMETILLQEIDKASSVKD